MTTQRCVVQGFGNVGGVAASELHDQGATVIAVSDISGGVYAPGGLEIPELHAYVAQHGSLEGYDRCQRITNEELLELECDILIVAAREDQLTGENAGRVHASLIVEGANGPTTLEADAIFAERKIPVVPDILANAGGVTVSYFEWVQDLYSFFWDPDVVRNHLEKTIRRAYEDVAETARRHDTDLRTGALILAVGRVEETTRLRGLFP
jgi:glutamate dehydrogenase (NAD(P)+)